MIFSSLMLYYNKEIIKSLDLYGFWVTEKEYDEKGYDFVLAKTKKELGL